MYGAKFSQRLPRNFAWGVFAAGTAIALLMGALAYVQAAFITRLDYVALDAFLKHSASERPARNTIAIDIDDLSLAAVGQWPWPRYRVAALIQAIASAEPAAIGIDVLFPEPDSSSLINVRQAFKRDFDVDLSFAGAPAGLSDNDGYFGYVLGRAGAVGAKYFYFDHRSAPGIRPASGFRVEGDIGLLELHDAPGALFNTDKIASQTRYTGFVNSQADDDGTLRRLPLLIRHEGVVHPHLALATVMKALGASVASIEHDGNGPLIRIAEHRIPIDARGYALLRFAGRPALYKSMSAVSVLNGSFRPQDLAGKIVFVGSSAVGLNDLHNTAFDRQFPGLKVQAVMAENIIDGDFVREPEWSRSVALASCLAVGLLMSLLFVVATGPALALGGTAAIAAIPVAAAFWLHAATGLFVSPASCVVVAVLLFVLFSVVRFAVARRQAYTWYKRMENARQVTIESMAAVAETRDPETGAHIKRTQHYVKAIAEELRRGGHHRALLTSEYIELLFISAPLHDVGKVGIPDHILLKPGKLTDEEFLLMKRHADFGRSIILSTAQSIEGDNYLQIAGEIAATHHEKWDGTGYPVGLAAEAIPLSGRIMAVADIYDALISRRCYKEPFPHVAATTLMREARGTTFDPVVLDAFFAIEDEVKRIAARYPD